MAWRRSILLHDMEGRISPRSKRNNTIHDLLYCPAATKRQCHNIHKRSEIGENCGGEDRMIFTAKTTA